MRDVHGLLAVRRGFAFRLRVGSLGVACDVDHEFPYNMSTPEQKCIGSPEQKYINDVGKKPPELGAFVRHQAWLG